MTTHVPQIFGSWITSHLDRMGKLPLKTEWLVNEAVVRLMDSEMIIEDDFATVFPPPASSRSVPVRTYSQTGGIDLLCEAVNKEGLGEHFHQIVGAFGSILLEICGSDDQKNTVQEWVGQNIFGHFLMTDSGGPSLASWRSVLTATSGDIYTLSVQKKWAIEGHDLGFAVVACRRNESPIPTMVLLSPEKCRELSQRSCGAPFLDDRLQLGDVSGQVTISSNDFLSSGGPNSVNRFLTIIRPRFVNALMNHLLWLERCERIKLDEADKETLGFTLAVVDWCTSQTEYSIHSIDQVLALKFLSNEFLQSLVLKDAVDRLGDQRDLLAFTKMEGSSYRCVYEIYKKICRQRG